MKTDLSSSIPSPQGPLQLSPATPAPLLPSPLFERILFTSGTDLPGNRAPWAPYLNPVPSLSIHNSQLISIPAAFAKAPQRGQARLLIMPQTSQFEACETVQISPQEGEGSMHSLFLSLGCHGKSGRLPKVHSLTGFVCCSLCRFGTSVPLEGRRQP